MSDVEYKVKVFRESEDFFEFLEIVRPYLDKVNVTVGFANANTKTRYVYFTHVWCTMAKKYRISLSTVNNPPFMEADADLWRAYVSIPFDKMEVESTEEHLINPEIYQMGSFV